MRGFVCPLLCALLVSGAVQARPRSLLAINPFREFCLAPCRATCSFFSLGCSFTTCQVCIASCDNVCDTRDRVAFPDVLGIGGFFPFFSQQGQNAFGNLFSMFTDNGASSSSSQGGSGGGGGLLDMFFGGRPASYPRQSYPNPGRTSQNGRGFFDLFLGGQPASPGGESSVRKTPPGPSIFDLFGAFANFSAPLLESFAESLENSTALFDTAYQGIDLGFLSDDRGNTTTATSANSTSSIFD